ncbi:MAG: hypothetical protein R3C45_15785 [Phycisphaerales bacterium]
MVFSIRHDRFGPGRLHPSTPCHGHEKVAPAHRHVHASARRHRPEVRVVEHTQQPKPPDCHPHRSGEPARPLMNPVFQLYAPTISVAWPYNALHADPAVLLPPVAVQSFAYGQSVPAAGGLLDVFA